MYVCILTALHLLTKLINFYYIVHTYVHTILGESVQTK